MLPYLIVAVPVILAVYVFAFALCKAADDRDNLRRVEPIRPEVERRPNSQGWNRL